MKLAILNPEQIYFFELGRFVTQFSKLESMVFLFLADLTGLSKDECNAITSGVKIDGCANFIKRIYEARGQEVPEIVADCLDKIGPINKLRNDLLHSGADGDMTVSNELRALPKRVVKYAVTPKLLCDATDDVGKATLILSNIIAEFDGTPDEMQAAREVMTAPWRYTPPPPNNNHQPPPPKPRKRKRPR